MAGPNLEVFKFGLYLFFPLAAMVHFGKPEWYTRHVLPYRDHLFPPPEQINADIPVERSAIREHLAQLKADRRAKKLERDVQTGLSSEKRLV